jgi:hypothetical protein
MSAKAESAYEGVISIENVATPGAPSAGVPKVQFVHYPDAQQIQFWLPRSIYEDDGYQDVVVARDGVEIEREATRSKVNGSIQMLFATLGWPPGDYLIAVTHRDGWRHEVRLRKYPEGQRPPEPPRPSPPPQPEASSDGPLVYRDGAGNLIPDVAYELRTQIKRDIARRFARHLEYEGNYRAGTIVYGDGDRVIRFSHEMCGGDLKFAIDIPTIEHWEAATGTPLSERDEIVGWLAGQVQRDQAPSWKYRITPNSIDFY